MREFPASLITALIDGSPQYDLGESYAPHLSVADILDPAELAGLSLGYGSAWPIHQLTSWRKVSWSSPTPCGAEL